MKRLNSWRKVEVMQEANPATHEANTAETSGKGLASLKD